MTDNVIDADFNVETEYEFHTVLEVWRAVLTPSREEATKRVTAGWASKMVNTYPGVEFAEMNSFRDSYFAKINELLTILEDEIDSDKDCLTYGTPAEDAAENRSHYIALLTNWQRAILQWELDWDCEDPYAAVELGCISEVHKMFFGQTGLTQFLDNIQLVFTDEDQAELAADLQSLREAATGE